MQEIQTNISSEYTCDRGSLAKVSKLSSCCVPAPVLQAQRKPSRYVSYCCSRAYVAYLFIHYESRPILFLL